MLSLPSLYLMGVAVFAAILYVSPKAPSIIVWILIACIGCMLYAMPAVLEGFADNVDAKKARKNAPRMNAPREPRTNIVTNTDLTNVPRKNVAKNVAKDTAKNVVKDTGKNVVKDTGKNVVKDTGKNVVKNVAKNTDNANAAEYDMLLGKLNEIIKPQNSIAFLTPELGEKTAVGLTELPKEHSTTRSMPEDAGMVPTKSKALEQGQSFHSTLPSRRPSTTITRSTPPVKCPDLEDYVRKDKVARDYVRRKDMPDMREYVRRKDIPPMPDMRDFVRKQDIPPQPNMREYIRKDSIPCWGCKLK